MARTLTLVIMYLPTLMRTTHASLNTVPHTYREDALRLGAGEWRVLRTAVLAGSLDGVITACRLSIGSSRVEHISLISTCC